MKFFHSVLVMTLLALAADVSAIALTAEAQAQKEIRDILTQERQEMRQNELLAKLEGKALVKRLRFQP